MKKRNLLVTLLLVLTMLITACGSGPSPFEGKWKGTCDLTDYIVDMMVSEYPDYEQYLNFEDLSFVINFTFEGENVEMSVDEASVDTFVANAEAGMYTMMDQMMIDTFMSLVPEATTLDEVAASLEYESGQAMLDAMASESGYENYEDMLIKTIAAADLGSMVAPLTSALDLSGTYEYDEETGILTITYDDDNTYEEMKFKFEGDVLTITVSDGEVEFDIVCEKQ